MSLKHHCLICSSLICCGIYCSTCSVEMNRSRYFNEESFHEWLERSRSGSWDNIVESGGRNLYSFSAKVVGETAFQL